jgi:hypothetical protein
MTYNRRHFVTTLASLSALPAFTPPGRTCPKERHLSLTG